MLRDLDAGGVVACPVPADLGEEAVLDRVPLRGGGWIVADGEREAEGIRQFALERVSPSVVGGAVAATVVGQDEQLGGLGVTGTAFGPPPRRERVQCEVGGVVRLRTG